MDLDLQPPQQDRHLLQTPRPQTSRYAAFETPQPDLELPPQASSSSISHPRKCMPISSLLSSHTQVYDNHRALHYSDSSTNGSSSEENDNASDISSDSDIGSNHGISASSRYNMHMISNQGGGHQSGVDHLALPNGTICSSLGPEINELQSRAVNPESELVDLKRYMARQYNHMLYMVDRLSSVNKFHSGKVSQTQPISNKSSQGTTQDPMLPDGDDSHDPSNDNQPNQISHHRYHQQHHHHHHHHHHYHHHSCRRQNSNDNDPGYDQSSDKNSIAIIEARTEDELYSNGNYNTYKPQQATETAKKDHHMHIHNFGNGGTTLASSSGTNTSSDKLGNRQNEVNFSFDTAKHNMNQKPPQGMATSPHRQEQGMTTPSPHQQD
ncbi:hypothetical protein BC941DRAFT_435898 [Chlamydoabsidia padenii]|nr:hypothetical protein BC941DRAFT_435898 [Chlamydoabsidia padenii]